MSRGAAGWCCLVLWLPACVAAHGERRREGGRAGLASSVRAARTGGHGSPWGPREFGPTWFRDQTAAVGWVLVPGAMSRRSQRLPTSEQDPPAFLPLRATQVTARDLEWRNVSVHTGRNIHVGSHAQALTYTTRT